MKKVLEDVRVKVRENGRRTFMIAASAAYAAKYRNNKEVDIPGLRKTLCTKINECKSSLENFNEIFKKEIDNKHKYKEDR